MSYLTTTCRIPLGSTRPQITEGTEVCRIVDLPPDVVSVSFELISARGTSGDAVMALFIDSDTDAAAVVTNHHGDADILIGNCSIDVKNRHPTKLTFRFGVGDHIANLERASVGVTNSAGEYKEVFNTHSLREDVHTLARLSSVERYDQPTRGTVFIVESPVECARKFRDFIAAVGVEVYIDDVRRRITGIEMKMPAGPIRRGELIGLLVRDVAP